MVWTSTIIVLIIGFAISTVASHLFLLAIPSNPSLKDKIIFTLIYLPNPLLALLQFLLLLTMFIGFITSFFVEIQISNETYVQFLGWANIIGTSGIVIPLMIFGLVGVLGQIDKYHGPEGPK